MHESTIPESSADLKRWIQHARDSRAFIERGLKGMDVALKNIEEIADKAPRTPKKDGPGPG